MALIREVRGHTPVIGENTFLAETAVVLGDVTIGRDCSIWYNAVLRGDVNKIVIGDRTNIQDGVVLHTIYDKAKHPSQTIIGNDVSVGHNAVVHGAVIEDNCLIGMGVCRGPGPQGQGDHARAAGRDRAAHGPRLHALRLVV